MQEDIGSARAVEVVPVMSLLLLFDELCLVLCLQSTVVVVGVGSGVVASFFQIVRWWLFVAAALEIYAHTIRLVLSRYLCVSVLLCSVQRVVILSRVCVSAFQVLPFFGLLPKRFALL